MKSLIILALFVGMFLVVQSTYETRIRDLEDAARAVEDKRSAAAVSEEVAAGEEPVFVDDNNPFHSPFSAPFARAAPL